jgi:AcrR family transcriptional regulator
METQQREQRRPYGRRRRRSPEQARNEILDAAERRLAAGGPEAIRLKEIAADAGMSHPTLLHHFGSRQGLVEALAQRTMRGLASDLLAAIHSPGPVASAPATLDRVFQILSEAGHARLLVWRVLAGWTQSGKSMEATLLGEVTKTLHARLTSLRHQRRLDPPSRDETAFTTLLAAFAIVGEAVVGSLVLNESELGISRPEFRDRLVRLVLDRLVGDAPGGADELVS